MPELPADVRAAAERLTRLARRATDDDERAAYEHDRDERLADHGFVSRVREDDDTLVLHPAEWVEDGTVRPGRIDDTDRAVEIPLSGTGDPDEWERVEAHNAAIVEAVADHGEVHRANARAFADFMGNHYARRVETASPTEVEEFLTEYYPRNAWPSDDERAVVTQSLALVFEEVEREPPDAIRR